MVSEYLKTLKRCKYCNKELKPIGYDYLYANIDPEYIKYERCDCNEAKKYWNKIDIKFQKEENMKKNKKIIDEIYKNYRTMQFSDSHFENFIIEEDNKANIQNIYQYLNDCVNKKQSDGLIITGDIGSGKTHIVIGIAHKLIESGQIVLFGRLNRFLDRLKETYNDENKSDVDIIQLYSNVEMLIIDDLGTEKISQWMLDKLYTILCNRFENDLPIIITTRFDKEGLIYRLSQSGDIDLAEAIAQKLYQNCYGIELIKAKKVSISDETKC